MNTSVETLLESMRTHQPESGYPGYKPIEWRWDLDQDSFEFLDSEVSALVTKLQIQSSQDLLALFASKERNKLVKALRHTAECGTQTQVFCSMVTAEDQVLIYAEWEVKKHSESVLVGSVQPILAIPLMGHIAEMFTELFDNPHHGVVVTDANTTIIACNSYFSEKSGYQLKDLLGKKTNIFNAGKHSSTFFDDIWQQVERRGFWSGAILSKRASGAIEPQELSLQKVELSNNQVYYVGYTVDLSNHLYRVADSEHGGVELLTQLPNETQFIAKLLSLAENKPVSETIIVMTFLPEIDSELAIEQRMALSNAIAQIENRYLCGYMRDNLFVAALRCDKGDNSVRNIHSEIRHFFTAIKRHASEDIYARVVKGKVGVSVLGFDTANPNSLVTHATQAMLEQHSSKGYNISFFDTSIHKEAQKRKQLEEALVQAIRNEDINVFFQPIVSTADWRVVKFEALCRFGKLNGKEYSAQEVINLAEDLNLITSIDRCVGKLSLTLLKKIRQHFGSDIELTINRSLNTKMSAEQVLSNALSMVENSDIAPQLVTIELTESAYFASEERQLEALQALRSKGVKVAIDDFGSGYSSFSYLSNGHFDYLKIDREFVADIEVGTHKYFIVKTLINLSHTLGVKVIAEGAETIQEIKVLTDLGVDYIQGFYFSKPVPIEQIEKARQYTSKLNELRPLSVPARGAGILSMCDFGAPLLEPSTALSEVKQIFDHSKYDALAVIDQDRCVGIIDREVYNLHISPTLGTKLETQQDSKILKRKLSQVMRREFTTLSHKTTINDVARLLSKNIRLPWVIAGDKGECLGVVSAQRIIEFFIR